MRKVSLGAIILIFCFISASSQSCLPNGISIHTQEEIDSFQFHYPNCTEIEGSLWIHDFAIKNLYGLNGLNSVGEKLVILETALNTLEGLDSLVIIGGDLYIGISDENAGFYEGNSKLKSLTGLGSLDSIGGNLGISNNDDLTSLSGLENLTFIGGNLKIGGWYGNWSLTSLTGMDNVISIGGNLYIRDNQYLSHCSVLSICNYLSNPNGSINIGANATGCDYPYQVQDSCYWVSVDNHNVTNNLLLFPNPASRELNISAEGRSIQKASIFTLTGQQVFTISPVPERIDISSLRPGIYVLEVMVENRKIREKLVVQ